MTLVTTQVRQTFKIVGLVMSPVIGLPAAAYAASVVGVQLAPAVQARSAELGHDELAAEQTYLRQDVARALAHGDPTVRVQLVIQDIQPTRPTSSQLGLSTGLSAASVGLGGAAVTGQVIAADGTIRPIRYRFFQTTLRNELDFTTWGDANDAFDQLAEEIASGKLPNEQGAWPPPHVSRPPTGTRLGP